MQSVFLLLWLLLVDLDGLGLGGLDLLFVVEGESFGGFPAQSHAYFLPRLTLNRLTLRR